MISAGGYLPERVVSNHDLAAVVDTSDEWIRQRTGIAQRHIVAEGEKTSDLARQAGELSGRLLSDREVLGNNLRRAGLITG